MLNAVTGQVACNAPEVRFEEVRFRRKWLALSPPRTPFLESLRLPDDGDGIAVITFASPQHPVTRSGHESHYLRRKNLESVIVTRVSYVIPVSCWGSLY
jgi:hypothetical protein